MSKKATRKHKAVLKAIDEGAARAKEKLDAVHDVNEFAQEPDATMDEEEFKAFLDNRQQAADADPTTVTYERDGETFTETVSGEELDAASVIYDRVAGSGDAASDGIEVLPPEPVPERPHIISIPRIIPVSHPLVQVPQAQAILCGSNRITRDELRGIPTPEGTRTHKPVPHIDVVEALIESLSFRHITVAREEYAITKEGLRLFGVLELDHEFSGCRFAIGLRNANDKMFRLGLTVGYRVMVCENLAFSGDFRPVLAKHSARLELRDVLSVGIDRMQRNFEPIKRTVRDWQETTITDDQAKLAIYDAFIAGSLPAPRKLAAVVDDNFFHPKYPDFEPRTLWSLENAFTSAFKELPAARQFSASGKLHSFLQGRVTPF